MEIDVTRKLRPRKAADLAAAAFDPAVADPAAANPSGAVPPPVVGGSHTVRFIAGGSHEDHGGHPAAEPDPVTGWLVVMKGMGAGRSLPLGYGIHPLGRGEDQRISVRFGDKRISRRSHVEIGYDGESRRFYICPGRAGSSFGYLNGHPVLQPSQLKAGDQIRVGGTELAFVPFCGETFDWQER